MKYIISGLIAFALFLYILTESEPEVELRLSYWITQTSDTTYSFNAMIVREGDLRIYGKNSFKYKMRDNDSIVKAHSEFLKWSHKIADEQFLYLKSKEN